MITPIELVPLKCIQCDTPIPAHQDEVAWVCEACGEGQQLTELGLIPLEIHYARGIQPSMVGIPFWVCDGQVALDREAYSGFRTKNKDAQQFWSKSRRFIIPAFEFPLDELTRIGPGWIQQPPDLQEGEPAQFKPVTVTPEDVSALAEFIVLALEAERSDKIKSLRMSLKLDDLELWILPSTDSK